MVSPRQLALVVAAVLLHATGSAQPSADRFDARRAAVLNRVPGSLLLVPSRGEAKTLTETGLRQAPDVLYLTGLAHPLRVLLVLDGTTGQSHLFVPPADGAPFPGLALAPGDETAAALGLDSVQPWDAFVDYVDSRVAAVPDLVLRVRAEQPLVATAFGDAPPGLAPVYGAEAVWRAALAARWPAVEIADDDGALWASRSLKDADEVAAIRRASTSAVSAVEAVLGALRTGLSQRAAEAVAVTACLETGADGVAWWPWVMTGPNAAFPATFASFGDYRHLDRVMERGDLARVDLGCETDHYTSDVGRTAPVSGVWTVGQRETWDLLIDAYRAGLERVRDGVTPREIRDAFQAEVRARRPAMETPLGRAAADLLLTEEGLRYWQLHHVGIGPSEGGAPLDVPIRAGMVVAYEPIFTVEGQGFYLEDLLLITADGYDLLTSGVPTTSDEIEAAMR